MNEKLIYYKNIILIIFFLIFTNIFMGYSQVKNLENTSSKMKPAWTPSEYLGFEINANTVINNSFNLSPF